MSKNRPSLELVVSAPVGTWGLDEVVQSLRQSREETHNIRYRGQIRELPSREALTKILDGLSAALFPTHYGQPVLTDESIDYFVGDKLNIALNDLAEQVRRALHRQGNGRCKNRIWLRGMIRL